MDTAALDAPWLPAPLSADFLTKTLGIIVRQLARRRGLACVRVKCECECNQRTSGGCHDSHSIPPRPRYACLILSNMSRKLLVHQAPCLLIPLCPLSLSGAVRPFSLWIPPLAQLRIAHRVEGHLHTPHSGGNLPTGAPLPACHQPGRLHPAPLVHQQHPFGLRVLVCVCVCCVRVCVSV